MPLDLTHLIDEIIERGLQGASIEAQVEAFGNRVVGAGFPARRFNLAIGTLHPQQSSRSYVWRSEGVTIVEFPRRRGGDQSEAYLRSPIHWLRSTGHVRLRRRLDAGIADDDFPVLADLTAEGMSDYAARLVRSDGGSIDSGSSTSVMELGDPADPLLQGVFFSCTTDQAGGFDAQHLEQVDALLPYLALAVKSRMTADVARTLLATYLGADAGRRVLTGEVDRYSVQRIPAVIWLCDLRGFSTVAGRVPPEELVEILNAYFEFMALPVLGNGGQILKFLGDGFLATFDLSQRAQRDVCIAAMRAARQLLASVPAFDAQRSDAGGRTMNFGVALHLGEVLYGNVGTRDRLDFTVVGSAVNEASRIEGLCKILRQRVLVSSTFYEAATACRDVMISVGTHKLRGIREPQGLFTIPGAEYVP